MGIEEALRNCEIYQKQIKRYDPDPFYVNFFLKEYLDSVNKVLDEIFYEANRDFGLFILGKITQQKFQVKAKEKNDEKAIKFSEWYATKFNKQHENSYPKILKKIFQLKNKTEKIPEIKIMIRASDRYKDDIYQQIKVELRNKKLTSREELDIEIRRQLPIFLKLINHKREIQREPKVRENQVTASAFLNIEKHENVEISYATELYLTTLKRLVKESRNKIKELTSWR